MHINAQALLPSTKDAPSGNAELAICGFQL